MNVFVRVFTFCVKVFVHVFTSCVCVFVHVFTFCVNVFVHVLSRDDVHRRRHGNRDHHRARLAGC